MGVGAAFPPCLLLLLVPACQCFQWTGSLQDGDYVAVCVDSNVSLPWTYTLNSEETVGDMEWSRRSATENEVTIATSTGGMFLATPTFFKRVHSASNGGLLLSHVTLRDSGQYTVKVDVHKADGTFNVYRKTALVEVTDGLRVREEPGAVYDPVTDSWHVYLSCGTVVSPEQSPDHIVWKTPSGVVPSTKYGDGHFYLQLENPVKGGNYSCSLAPNSTASVCLPLSSQEPKVEVDGVRLRVSVLEVENTHIKTENADLRHRVNATETELTQTQTDLAQTQTELLQIQSEVQDLRTIVHGLVNTTNTLQERARRQVSFYALLSSNTQFTSGQPVILPRVDTNQGDAYSKSTGSFTAPYDGTYFFAATASCTKNSFVRMNVMVDDTMACYTTSYDDDGKWDSNTCAVTVRLTAGQRVWLKSTDTATFFAGAKTTFTGFLVSADN